MNRLQASIIVLCYNGLEETTRPCLDSLIKNTPKDSYELIIVDNASHDGTADYLQTFARQHAHVRIQLNDRNKGYSGGNNDGLRLAQGEHVVLLNNDTLVPDGWLDRLLGLFREQPDIGLIGPVTNSAGNEQCITLDGLSEQNYEQRSQAYINRQRGVWFPTDRLGFFCVAMRRNLLDNIGYLDENFGLGMFEDDDYCLRTKKAGFTLAVVEDCFIYHKGSVSFKKLTDKNYRELFEKNKTYFREKHQIEWTITNLTLAYWKKFNLDLQAYVNSHAKLSPEIERILIRNEHLKYLLLQVHDIELASVPSGIRAASMDCMVARIKWQRRWGNFKRNMIDGTLSEKRYYLHSVLRKILPRCF